MFCKTVYPNFEAIPEFARNDFEQQPDGTWKMKQDAIEGAPEHFNAGLASNRDRALEQLKAANAARDAAITRAEAAESQVQNVTAGGGRVLSPADAKAFDGFVALGDLKTVQQKVSGFDAATQKLQAIEGEGAIKTVAEKTGLDFAALNEWFSHPTRGEGYKPFYKEVPREVEEMQNGVLVKVTKNVPVAFVTKTVVENGVAKETEHELLTEAKNVLPQFQFSALTAKPAEGTGENQPPPQANPFGVPVQQPTQPPVVLPMLGGGTGTGGSNPQQPANLPPAQEFQAARDAIPSPFAVKK